MLKEAWQRFSFVGRLPDGSAPPQHLRSCASMPRRQAQEAGPAELAGRQGKHAIGFPPSPQAAPTPE